MQIRLTVSSSKCVCKQSNTADVQEVSLCETKLWLLSTDIYFPLAKHAIVGTSQTMYKQMLLERIFNILFGNWVDKWNKMAILFVCKLRQDEKKMFNWIFSVEK